MDLWSLNVNYSDTERLGALSDAKRRALARALQRVINTNQGGRASDATAALALLNQVMGGN